MSFREEQCNKVCRILDDVLANRPTERDSLITAVRIAFSALNCSEIPKSSDCIDRRAAIDALDKRFDNVPMEQTTEILLLRKDLKEMPSAQPESERKTGKWIEFPNHMAYKCSECGRIIQTTDGRRNVSKHCPFCHCGADMREGGQDGNK